MQIELNEFTVRELVEGYHDDGEGGVVGFGGKLDIRPPYQREFVYDDKQREKVIDTVTKGFPLNVMYWSVRGDGTYEIIDGQQRTISIAQYVHGTFSFDDLFFQNLPQDKREQILEYIVFIYLCAGTESEKLRWYETINIAGEVLTKQELRNAVYAGPWVSDAKKYFSRQSGPAYNIGKDYLRGSPIRQDYFETVIKWISEDNIEDYMGRHQHETSSEPLRTYFRAVIDWIEATFTNKRAKFMRGVDWGGLYNRFKDTKLNPALIEEETARLVFDDDVTRKAGIYPYILTRDEKHLNIRSFSAAMKQKAYEQQEGLCVICDEDFEISQMEADHIIPWAKGGKTNADNCQMLCRKCNREKSSK